MRRAAYLLLACSLAGCSISTSPVDFARLGKNWKPNQYLVCPKDYCRGDVPDQESPVFDLSVENLQARTRETLLLQPRTEILREDSAGRQLILVQRTERAGWPDTIFIQFIPLGADRSTLAIYSRSNYGISDRGVNRVRIQDWLAAVTQAAGSKS